MPGRGKRRGWRWAVPIALFILLAAGLGLLAAYRTPVGRAVSNVVEYRLRVAWRRWSGREADASVGGAIAGLVRDGTGQPLAGATVLVSTVTGVVYEAQSDALGAYQIEHVPPGRYVPAATQWGYDTAVYHEDTQERTPVTVRTGKLASGVDLTLHRHQPWRPDIDGPPVIGPQQTATATFPAEIAVSRVPVTYVNEGLIITTTVIYEPLERASAEPLPVIVATYPSPPLNWERISVALANEGYVVLGIGPSPQRQFDIPGMGRDLIKAVAYLRDGQLTGRADTEREGWLAGSYGSLIVFRALLEDPDGVDAFVLVGSVTDAFLLVQSLYADEALLPPQHVATVAALDPPDMAPDVYLGYSMAFYAAHLPPTLVVHTKVDEVVPYNQSLRLADALQAAGVTHELFIYEDTSHYLDPEHATPGTAELYRRLVTFLDRYVRRADNK